MRDNSPVYLTFDGSERLRRKLARLKLSLSDLINEAQRTAEYGDRSDNAEYKEAKSLLRRTYRQIFSIEDQLKRVVIIKTKDNQSETVQLGSTVVIESKESGRQTFQILGPRETDPERGRISFKSPLGSALMNRSKGETVTIQTAHGLKEYIIVEII